MKNPGILSVMLVFALFMAMPVLADVSDAESADSQAQTLSAESAIQSEVGSMDNPAGAEVRLLQLERAIANNIARGNAIIADAGRAGNDTSTLAAIISSMSALKDEVAATDPNASDAVQKYVEYKMDAINLSKEFRDSARMLLGPNLSKELWQKAKGERAPDDDSITREISDAKREYLLNSTRKIFSILNITDDSLLSQVESGNASFREVNKEIKSAFSNLTKAERKALADEMRDEGIKKNVVAASAIAKARQGQLLRQKSRLEARLGNVNDRLANITARQAGQGSKAERTAGAKEGD